MSLKIVLVLSCILAMVMAKDMYTTKYDNINIDEILATKRLLKGYIDCLTDKGKCTPEGKELKDNLKDALETGCEKCSEIQESQSYKIIEHLIEHEHEAWVELCNKYDATGEWRKKYEDRAKEHGIKLD